MTYEKEPVVVKDHKDFTYYYHYGRVQLHYEPSQGVFIETDSQPVFLDHAHLKEMAGWLSERVRTHEEGGEPQ